MSSPVVLTSVIVPLEVAKARNRADAAEYLELAEALAARLVARSHNLQEQGIMAPLPSRDPASVRRKVESTLRRGDGWEGVKLAHAYWQSLKHDISDALDRLEVESLIVHERETAEKNRAEAARLQNISNGIVVEYEQSAPQFLVAGSGTEPANQVDIRVAAIHLAAKKLGIDCHAEVREILEHQGDDRQRIATLEVLRTSLEERVVREIREQAYERIRTERLHEDREIALQRLTAVREAAESLASIDRENLKVVVKQCAERIALCTSREKIDEAVMELRNQLAAAQARKSLYDTIAAELRRQGYEEVNEMRTLSATDMKTRYFANPIDDERFVEIGIGDEGTSVSAEIVRINQDQSSESKVGDADAQRTLCSMVDAAIARSSQTSRIVEISRIPAGGLVRIVPQLSEYIQQENSERRQPARLKEARQ